MKKKFFSIAAAAVLAACVPASFAGCSKKEKVVDPIDDNYRVFYQIFVGSFSDSDGDGTGDLRGIINRMDYLNDGDVNSGKSLGVQGIWLSPIFSSPSYHKYDATDYYRVDPKFGTDDDLKELLNICHERNVKVILDLAINHTSSSNAWFAKFRQARRTDDVQNPYYDYYTCVTSETKIAGHTYYGLAGNPSLYYEGNFSSDMPELNFDSQNVRNEMVNVARHYLDMGVDGFRFDAVKYIYYNDTTSSVEFWNWYMGELKTLKDDIYTVGECWSGDGEVLDYYPALNCFSFASSQSSGQIASASNSGRFSSFASYVTGFQKNIKEKNPEGMYCPFISNHDMDRAAGYLDVSRNYMQMAANLYILCHGSPFIYYGEEIGMKGSRGGANTDANRRLAMLWGDKDNVANPVGSTYNPELQINGTVASQKKNKNSLLNYYRRLIEIRNKHPEIARGEYKTIVSKGAYGGFSITYNGNTIGLFHNTGTESAEITLPDGVSFNSVSDCIGAGKVTLNGNKLIIDGQTSTVLV